MGQQKTILGGLEAPPQLTQPKSAGPDWFVAVNDRDPTQMALPQLVELYALGAIHAKTPVWRVDDTTRKRPFDFPEIAEALHARGIEPPLPGGRDELPSFDDDDGDGDENTVIASPTLRERFLAMEGSRDAAPTITDDEDDDEEIGFEERTVAVDSAAILGTLEEMDTTVDDAALGVARLPGDPSFSPPEPPPTKPPPPPLPEEDDEPTTSLWEASSLEIPGGIEALKAAAARATGRSREAKAQPPRSSPSSIPSTAEAPAAPVVAVGSSAPPAAPLRAEAPPLGAASAPPSGEPLPPPPQPSPRPAAGSPPPERVGYASEDDSAMWTNEELDTTPDKDPASMPIPRERNDTGSRRLDENTLPFGTKQTAPVGPHDPAEGEASPEPLPAPPTAGSEWQPLPASTSEPPPKKRSCLARILTIGAILFVVLVAAIVGLYFYDRDLMVEHVPELRDLAPSLFPLTAPSSEAPNPRAPNPAPAPPAEPEELPPNDEGAGGATAADADGGATEEKPDEVGTEPFDARTVKKALNAASAKAVECYDEKLKVLGGVIVVTFEPSGRVSNVRPEGQLAGNKVGLCVAGVFREVRIPAFRAKKGVSVRHAVALKK